MAKILKIIVLLVFVFQVNSVFADSNQALMDVASKHYTEGNYREAIDTYNQILLNGYESSELYYNLGNSYYKSSELAYAILYYEKAKLLAPNDEDINFNLNLSRSHTVDKLDEIPDFFLTSWYNNLYNLLLTDTWAIISMGTFALSLLIFLIFFISSASIIKRLSFYSGLLILLISIFAFTFSLKGSSIIQNRNTAIIFSPSVTVKSSPDESGTDLFLLHEGTKVQIMDSVSDWLEIKLIDGNEGWVEKKSLEVI